MRPILAAITLPVAACTGVFDTTAAERSVSEFHKLLDPGQFTDIYSSSDELRNTTSQSDFVPRLEAMHRKLGKVRSAKKTGWSVNTNTSGTTLEPAYDTAYSGGNATESFVYVQDGKVARLEGYHISSNALILK